MHLLDLPPEILILLPNYLESLQDLRALALTCHAFSNIPSLINGDILFRLASSPHTGLQPYPHLLVATKARQLADWAVQDGSRRRELLQAIKGGTKKVLQLSLSISPLTLDDLRRIHSARFDVLIPLSEELDPEYGPKLGFFVGCSNLVLALTNFWTYCDLFHHTVSEGYSASRVRPFSATIRRAWLRFCVPDVLCTADFPRQSEQLDLRMILNYLRAETFEIVTGKKILGYMVPGIWIAEGLFHTGLPALTLLKTGSASQSDINIVNIMREKIRTGAYPYRDASSNEPDAWESMGNDIDRGWRNDWDSEITG